MRLTIASISSSLGPILLWVPSLPLHTDYCNCVCKYYSWEPTVCFGFKWPWGNAWQFICTNVFSCRNFPLYLYILLLHALYAGQMYAYYIILEFKLLLEPTQNCSDYLVSCLYNNKICSHVIARSIAVIECYIANMLSSLWKYWPYCTVYDWCCYRSATMQMQVRTVCMQLL